MNAARKDRFVGLSALVVEDELMVSMLIEQMLEDLGCTPVRTAATVAEAIAALEAGLPDIAALDVNLRGEPVFPVARKLAATGVPFVFVTGYGVQGLAPEWAGHPVLQKPFSQDALESCLTRAANPS